MITTDFVVDETLTLIRFRLGLSAAFQQVGLEVLPALRTPRGHKPRRS